MSSSLRALVAHARRVPAAERVRFADGLAARSLPPVLIVETCHRVEVYGEAAAVAELTPLAPPGSSSIAGQAVAQHLIRLAMGRESTVVGEDQVLHQLRSAARTARQRGALPPALDRLANLALAAGRRARTWLPSTRPNLGTLAVEQLLARGGRIDGPVLVVGAGRMGRLAAQALAARGVQLAIASRTPERSRGLATELRARSVGFDPGAEVVAGAAAVFVALSGPWTVSAATSTALVESGAWVVDLSAPLAVDETLRTALAGRLLTIDQLAIADGGGALSPRLLERLDALAERTLAEYEEWLGREVQRDVARRLAERAEAARSIELDKLWRRLPTLDPAERAEVERMADQLTRRLLRDPLERLSDDGDGRQASAARDFFRL